MTNAFELFSCCRPSLSQGEKSVCWVRHTRSGKSATSILACDFIFPWKVAHLRLCFREEGRHTRPSPELLRITDEQQTTVLNHRARPRPQPRCPDLSTPKPKRTSTFTLAHSDQPGHPDLLRRSLPYPTLPYPPLSSLPPLHHSPTHLNQRTLPSLSHHPNTRTFPLAL